MLCGELAVLQAPMLDGLSFDPFALFDDGCGPAGVGVGRCYVGQALVVAPMVVMLDEGSDLGLKIAGQEVVFEQDAVLQGLVPALDLALGLGMHWSAPNRAHGLSLDIVGQFTGDVARAVVTKQPGFVVYMGLVAARSGQRHVQCVGNVLGPHGAAQLPGDDVARVVVEHGGQIHPAPANDLEVSEVGLPHPSGSAAPFWCGTRLPP